jgi:hypothetical protein
MDPPNLPVRHKAGVDHSDHLGLAGNQEDDPFQVVLVSFLHLRRFRHHRHESFGVVDELQRRFSLLLGSFLSRDSWNSVQLVRAIFAVEFSVGVDMFLVAFVFFFVWVMQ